MDNDDDDDDAGGHGSWLHHPYTARTAKALKQAADGLLFELIGACERTTDPAVSAALGRYQQALTQMNLFRPRGA